MNNDTLFAVSWLIFICSVSVPVLALGVYVVVTAIKDWRK